ncbi:MAG: PilW family protein [Halanaerobiaceae bacterium]
MIRIIYEFKKQDGFTLVELLISLAISGILMTLIGSLYISYFSTYDKIQDMSSIQQDISVIDMAINKELRNAVNIDLLSSLPESRDGTSYIYVSKNNIFIETPDWTNSFGTNNIESLKFNIINSNLSNPDNKYILEYTINNKYTSTILLNNVSFFDGTSEHSIISYEKP